MALAGLKLDQKLLQYQYESLEGQGADAFRLFLLEPGKRSDPLRGSLFIARQSDDVDYDAVSYVWGDQRRHMNITVDEKCIGVGENLYNFLVRYRHSAQYRVLWADSLCIHQVDATERGHQVRLMGDIYRNAITVFAWLGDRSLNTADFDPDDVLRFMARPMSKENHDTAVGSNPAKDTIPKYDEDTSKALREVEKATTDLEQKFIDRFLPIEHQATINTTAKAKALVELQAVIETGLLLRKDTTYDRQTYGITMHAFADLCRRQYWTRTWIVQELLLAKSVVICIGEASIKWQDFSAIIEFGAYHLTNFIRWNLPVEMNRLQNFVEMMEMPVTGRRTSLETLLQQYKTQDCFDKRDKIYAFLALADDSDMIIPDYTQSLLDLFFQLQEVVHDHALLRRTLGLPSDEIKYRAETLKLQFVELGGEVYICPSNGLVSLDLQRHSTVATLPRNDRTATNDRRRNWAKLPEPYKCWARVRSHLEDRDVVVTKNEILQLRVHHEWYWLARTKHNQYFAFWDDEDIEILNIDYTGVEADTTETAQARRHAQTLRQEHLLLNDFKSLQFRQSI
jgi:hypothetical protein